MRFGSFQNLLKKYQEKVGHCRFSKNWKHLCLTRTLFGVQLQHQEGHKTVFKQQTVCRIYLIHANSELFCAVLLPLSSCDRKHNSEWYVAQCNKSLFRFSLVVVKAHYNWDPDLCEQSVNTCAPWAERSKRSVFDHYGGVYTRPVHKLRGFRQKGISLFSVCGGMGAPH